MSYDHSAIEEYWKKKWEEDKLYATDTHSSKKKLYLLVEFPYPSGEGLHVGHVRSYTAMDIIARKKRREGHEVLFPIGWDAFGLPAENYAIKTGIHPSVTTRKNIDNFRNQMKNCGFSFDWDREVDTTDPSYYKWTQWIFLKLYEKGLAYKREMPVNWCPKDKCVLANEEVVDGACERCGTPVEKRNKEQWMLAITKYAERLDRDLDQTAYLDKIKIQQRNWIGLSEGSEIGFPFAISADASFKFEDRFIAKIESGEKQSTRRIDHKGIQVGSIIELLRKSDQARVGFGKVTGITPLPLKDLPLEYKGGTSYASKEEQLASYQKYYGDDVSLETVFYTIDFTLLPSSFNVFTTRADTIFGCTYCVFAPEHPEIRKLLDNGIITNAADVERYIQESMQKLDIDRSAEGKEKTGLRLEGISAINPATKEEIPVFIADYVLPQYGTGAIMAVPAHDERDYEFAVKYDLPIRESVRPYVIDHVNVPRADKPTKVRRNVHAIVYDPKTKKYLIIRNSIHKWDTVVIGGVEEHEDPIEAAKRELAEETGYTDVESKKILGDPVQAGYFAPHKDENRLAIATGVYFELRSDARVEIPTDGENEGNEILWVDAAHFVPGTMINSELPFWLERIASEKPVLFTDSGILVNSGAYDGMTSDEAKRKITQDLGGTIVKKSKLRDWVFARQRYWGEPIPIVYDSDGKMHPVHADCLPIVLPQVDKYEPTDNGESPLYQVPEWVNVRGYIDENGYFREDASRETVFKRETDTMPQWAGSSWYFMRYIDPKNDTAIGDPALLGTWLPVDWYNGGMEHTTLHLLYSRFWYKFLHDIGVVPTSEPYYKRTSQGMILGAGGVKMSKSLGNVVNPDDIIRNYGADVLRMYEMFIGPFDQSAAWDDKAIVGVERFLEKVNKLAHKASENAPSLPITHQTIVKVSEGVNEMLFNTCISQLMICANEYDKKDAIAKGDLESYVGLLAPFAPFLAEELWKGLGKEGSVHVSPWPDADPELLHDETATIAIQIGGKLRGTIVLPRDTAEMGVLDEVKKTPAYLNYVGDGVPKKVVFVPNKLINIVI